MKFDIAEVKEFIKNSSSTSKIYFGVDSEVYKKRFKVDGKVQYERRVRYCTVVVIHRDGHRGAKIFGKIDNELQKTEDYSRPFIRMWREVEMITDLVKQFEDVLEGRGFEIHLDINSENYGSNVAYGAAKGYVQSMYGITPIMKNDGNGVPWAASYAADRMGAL